MKSTVWFIDYPSLLAVDVVAIQADGFEEKADGVYVLLPREFHVDGARARTAKLDGGVFFSSETAALRAALRRANEDIAHMNKGLCEESEKLFRSRKLVRQLTEAIK